MAGTNVPKGSLNEAELKALNKKYIGGIKEIILDRKVEKVRDEKGKETEKVLEPGIAFYLRKPDRGTIKYANSKTVKADQTIDMQTPGEIILKKCWVGGDEDIKNLDKYFFRACIECSAYMNELMGFI